MLVVSTDTSRSYRGKAKSFQAYEHMDCIDKDYRFDPEAL
jgi:hypothetical protein